VDGHQVPGSEYAISEAGNAPVLRPTEPQPQQALPFDPVVSDAPLCSECGGLMTRNGIATSARTAAGLAGVAKVSQHFK